MTFVHRVENCVSELLLYWVLVFLSGWLRTIGKFDVYKRRLVHFLAFPFTSSGLEGDITGTPKR